MSEIIPVVLFVYRRPIHTKEVLGCLRENRVPLIYAFCDGPRSDKEHSLVMETRGLLRNIDWCEVIIEEQSVNKGLGQSVLCGVSRVLESHSSILVCEDDLVFVPGTCQYLCAALRHYQEDLRVGSVTGWTHPSIAPKDIGNQPYFDGRAECWLWGTWARAWEGMNRTALEIVTECVRKKIDIYQYGDDLPETAKIEQRRNIWAVRWLFNNICRGSLCLRPPYSMVKNIGFDRSATNTFGAEQWANPPLRACPPIPLHWPEPSENLQCRELWRNACRPMTWYDRITTGVRFFFNKRNGPHNDRVRRKQV